MATYFARDGTPVVTAFALPENQRGEVTRYTKQGKQRLYTKERLEELNRRVTVRRNARHREKTMSELALAAAKLEFESFCHHHAAFLCSLQEHYVLSETLATYWQAINLGLILSDREIEKAKYIINKFHHRK